MRVRPLSARGWATVVLMAVLVLGGALRLANLGETGFWLDEIIAVLQIAPEHGPLHHAIVRLGLALHQDEAGVRLPYAIAGLVTIWLVYRVARATLPRAESLVAATLFTMAPLHVYHSREVKPYPLLVGAGAIACWALLRLASQQWNWHRQWRWHLLFAVAAVLLVLFSSHSSFYLAGLMTGYLLLIVRAPTWHARLLHLTFTLGISVLVLVLFWGLYGHIVSGFARRSPLPPTELIGRLAQAVVSGFTEDRTPSELLLIVLATAAIGVVALLATRALVAFIVSLLCLLGFFVPIVILRLEGHGMAARYELPALIPLVVLTAAGVGAACRAVARLVPSTPVVRSAIALMLMFAIGVATVDAQIGEVRRATHWNADWRRIATFIRQRAHPGDVVITSNDWGHLCLDYYLPRVGAQIRLENAQESIARAKQLMDANRQGFLIAGGFHADRSIRTWVDSFPTLATWRTEQIQLSFFPDRATYLIGRQTPQELVRDAQVFWNTRAGQLIFEETDDRFLLDGWCAAERDARQMSFRWVEGTHARLYLPVRDRQPRTLRLRVMPFGPTTPGQTLSLSVNASPVAQASAAPGWNELSISVTQAPWRYGANILTFDLSRAAGPADQRQLSCAFSLLSAEP